MKCLIQRVNSASVHIDGNEYSHINQGLLVFLGIGKQDSVQDIEYLVKKLLSLRIFEDETGKMNHSVLDKGFSILVVSQFTLYGNCSKGRRPSFDGAMPPAEAKAMYEDFVESVKRSGADVKTGVFGASMKVALENDGPVTLMVESPA